MPTFVTLGPSGTCHENALLRYLEHHGARDAEVELVDDFLVGVDLVREHSDWFLLQCSAHPLVHVVTERYRHKVFVVDTFIYPAKEMALLARSDVANPRTLGVVPAATGYVDLGAWETVTQETANPIVARNLLEGHYDAGVSFATVAEEHPEQVRLIERFGEVDTTWILFGKQRRFQGEIIGSPRGSMADRLCSAVPLAAIGGA
jgi:hypothetical protein